MKRFRALLPYAPYLLVSLLVMGSLLWPGFVLTMDMVFTPVIRMPNHVDNTWLFYAFLHAANTVLPADFIQKIILLAVLLLSGAGAHRLLTKMRPIGEKYWHLCVYVGAIFFMINPFVYDRFMAGQYGVLLGYSLLPWFASSLRAFVREPGWRSVMRLSAWVTAMSIVSIHSLGWVGVLGVVAACMYTRDRNRLVAIGKFMSVGCVIFAIAGAYWLAPAIFGHGRIADSLVTFGASERQAFATVDTNGTSTLGAVLGLQGFWQDNHQLYILPIDAAAQWGWLQVIVLALIVIGAVLAWKQARHRAVYGLVVSGIAILLALGAGGDWMAAHIPFFAGFREPQKFVAVLALAEMYFIAWGTSWVLNRAARLRYAVYPAAVVIMGVIFAYTTPMLWGFDDQLRAVNYPADWFAANRLLVAQADDTKVLFLPWHLYMSYDFAGRIIASPAADFFDRPIVASDDPELTGVAPQTHDATREALQSVILPQGAKGKAITSQLHALHVGYVMLAKENDWQTYAWLDQQVGLDVIQDTPTLRLYKLTNDTIGLHETN